MCHNILLHIASLFCNLKFSCSAINASLILSFVHLVVKAYPNVFKKLHKLQQT